MFLYSIIMFSVAALFTGISIAIYKGKTGLIHDYHQTNVVDKKAYGKAFGKAMFVLSGALFLSGIVSLLGETDGIALIAVAVLMVGMSVGFVCIFAVQKKYNNGIF